MPSKLCVRKEGWTHCVVEIEDIGERSFWGRLVDIKNNLLIDDQFVGWFNEDWHFVHDAEKILKTLPVNQP